MSNLILSDRLNKERIDRNINYCQLNLQDSDKKNMSYDSYELITSRNINHDSFTSNQSTSKNNSKIEIRSLKNERNMFRLTRSETNSPRIEYMVQNTTHKILANLAKIENTNRDSFTSNGRKIQHSNSSKSIEDLEIQWDLMKRHQSEKYSQSPQKYSARGLPSDNSNSDFSPYRCENRS